MKRCSFLLPSPPVFSKFAKNKQTNKQTKEAIPLSDTHAHIHREREREIKRDKERERAREREGG